MQAGAHLDFAADAERVDALIAGRGRGPRAQRLPVIALRAAARGDDGAAARRRCRSARAGRRRRDRRRRGRSRQSVRGKRREGAAGPPSSTRVVRIRETTRSAAPLLSRSATSEPAVPAARLARRGRQLRRARAHCQLPSSSASAATAPSAATAADRTARRRRLRSARSPTTRRARRRRRLPPKLPPRRFRSTWTCALLVEQRRIGHALAVEVGPREARARCVTPANGCCTANVPSPLLRRTSGAPSSGASTTSRSPSVSTSAAQAPNAGGVTTCAGSLVTARHVARTDRLALPHERAVRPRSPRRGRCGSRSSDRAATTASTTERAGDASARARRPAESPSHRLGRVGREVTRGVALARGHERRSTQDARRRRVRADRFERERQLGVGLGRLRRRVLEHEERASGSPTASSGVLTAARARRYAGSRTSTFFRNTTRVAAARGLAAAASRSACSCACAGGRPGWRARDERRERLLQRRGVAALGREPRELEPRGKVVAAGEQLLEHALGLGVVLGPALPLDLLRERVGRLHVAPDRAPRRAASGGWTRPGCRDGSRRARAAAARARWRRQRLRPWRASRAPDPSPAGGAGAGPGWPSRPAPAARARSPDRASAAPAPPGWSRAPRARCRTRSRPRGRLPPAPPAACAVRHDEQAEAPRTATTVTATRNRRDIATRTFLSVLNIRTLAPNRAVRTTNVLPLVERGLFHHTSRRRLQATDCRPVWAPALSRLGPQPVKPEARRACEAPPQSNLTCGARDVIYIALVL